MIYADTSFLLAMRLRRDTFHEIALDYYEARQNEIWFWSPRHRIEVFNSLRQLARHPEVQRRLSLAEAEALIRRIETDVRLDYFTHVEVDWRDVLRAANETSIAHAFEKPCRAVDVLHVAYAIELAAESFVSFDEDQLVLAMSAGLKTVRP